MTFVISTYRQEKYSNCHTFLHSRLHFKALYRAFFYF